MFAGFQLDLLPNLHICNQSSTKSIHKPCCTIRIMKQAARIWFKMSADAFKIFYKVIGIQFFTVISLVYYSSLYARVCRQRAVPPLRLARTASYFICYIYVLSLYQFYYLFFLYTCAMCQPNITWTYCISQVAPRLLPYLLLKDKVCSIGAYALWITITNCLFTPMVL